MSPLPNLLRRVMLAPKGPAQNGVQLGPVIQCSTFHLKQRKMMATPTADLLQGVGLTRKR
jgi:hypothetical protein